MKYCACATACFVLLYCGRPGAGYINKALRKQLAKNIDVCHNLSIFDASVPPTLETPRPFLYTLFWIVYNRLIVHIDSKIKLHFPILLMQARDETDHVIGAWEELTLLDDMPPVFYGRDEKVINCSSDKNDTLYIYNNTSWKRAGSWIPPDDFSNYSDAKVHFTLYYRVDRWFRVVAPIPYRAHANETFVNEDSSDYKHTSDSYEDWFINGGFPPNIGPIFNSTDPAYSLFGTDFPSHFS